MSETSPTAEQLEAWDDAYVWHPFTPHSIYRDEKPLTVVAGEGHYLIGARGERLLDGVGSIWCNVFGHRRPELDDAIRAQLDKIAHSTLLGNANDVSIKLAKRLVEIAPTGLTKVFYSDDGSTANEIAVKMALQFWQQQPDPAKRTKTRFLALSNAYNGDTVGAVSTGGIDLFHARFRPLLFDVIRGPSPYVYRRPEDQSQEEAERAFVAEMKRLVELHADELAAVIIEPGMQGAGGMITYPDGFLAQLRKWTRERDILLITDEVAMGMGRSGRMFACEREEISPDLMCIAKGLTGGYLPVAATLATERIYEAFLGPPEEGRTFFHGHTYTGNQLGCAAAIATLDVFESDRIIEGLAPKIRHLRQELRRLEALPWTGDVRQYGLAVGVELVADRASKASFPAATRAGMKVALAARERGVFLRPLGDVMVLMPPLTMSVGELTALVEALEHGMKTALPGCAP